MQRCLAVRRWRTPFRWHERSFEQCQKKYDATEVEHFAVVAAVGMFHNYFRNLQFVILIDHSTIVAPLKKKLRKWTGQVDNQVSTIQFLGNLKTLKA